MRRPHCDAVDCDVLIIGSEGAGARAAIAAAAAGVNVAVVTKGPLNRTGATLTATADVNVDSRTCREQFGLPGDADDTVDKFFEDTVIGGKFINDQTLVEPLVTEIAPLVQELVDWGLKIKALIRTPGHRYPRGIIADGADIAGTLGKRLRKLPNVRIIEYCMVLDLLQPDGPGSRVTGAVGFNFATGEYVSITAGAVILATGGGMALYPTRTAPDELTGDGHAMAFRAGADCLAMEMVQFMPCVFSSPQAWHGLQFVYEITPGATDGIAGWFLDRSGDRFMARYDPERMEKSTRDIISRAIAAEVRAGRGTPSGGVYYSLAHLPKNLVDRFGDWYPLLRGGWQYEHFDFSSLIEWMKAGNACEVSVGSHFFCGGVRIAADCATTLPGLYAAGEVAGGVHGANRLSGSAITQVLVQGHRAGAAAARWVQEAGGVARGVQVGTEPAGRVGKGTVAVGTPDAARAVVDWAEGFLARAAGTQRRGAQAAEVTPLELRAEVRDLAWQELGPLRTGPGLSRLLSRLAEVEARLPYVRTRTDERIYSREWVECLQLRSQIELARLIAVSALHRTESRGVHYRDDYPETLPDWGRRNVVVQNCGGRPVPATVPVPIRREINA